jgi:hypothetical protein
MLAFFKTPRRRSCKKEAYEIKNYFHARRRLRVIGRVGVRTKK